MQLENIRSFIICLGNFPDRLRNVAVGYLLMLMMEAPRHSMAFAAEVTGLDAAQFSRLLSGHGPLAKTTLETVAKKAAKRAVKGLSSLVKDAPWKAAIIIDGMLHTRSSLHVQNAQRFNHGQGFKIGHQWTNVVLHLGGKVIPLPPIPFYSKAECRRRKIPYLTAHERLQEYLETLVLSQYLGTYDPSEVVVLIDSGYDVKTIERLIVAKGWDFIVSLKSCRSVKSTLGKSWSSVAALFLATRKQAPWKTVRLKRDGKGKRGVFRARKLTGALKGLNDREVAIVCSMKSKGKGRRFLACSRAKASLSLISQVYRLRWQVELFHRAVKQQFGVQDIAAHSFDAVEAHVHWVYTAYVLTQLLPMENVQGLVAKQRKLTAIVQASAAVSLVQKVTKLRTCFSGKEKAKDLVAAVAQGCRAA